MSTLPGIEPIREQAEGSVPPRLDYSTLICELCGAASYVLAIPFDALRVQYGMAVEWGLTRRSLLASRDVENVLAMLEKLTLGTLARRV
jgi:hypothetical protein